MDIEWLETFLREKRRALSEELGELRLRYLCIRLQRPGAVSTALVWSSERLLPSHSTISNHEKACKQD